MGLFKRKTKKETEKDDASFQQAALRCPRDHKIMDKLKHPSGAILDICPSCGGMWLDRDEVLVLFNAKPSSGKGKSSRQKSPGQKTIKKGSVSPSGDKRSKDKRSGNKGALKKSRAKKGDNHG
ncbi:MAG: hypothetical protein GXP63_02520 [DPANN group archaeon]|nr:hypothetical protein [DPANN group archaeon]